MYRRMPEPSAAQRSWPAMRILLLPSPIGAECDAWLTIGIHTTVVTICGLEMARFKSIWLRKIVSYLAG